MVVLGIGEPISFLKNSKNLLSVLHVYVYEAFHVSHDRFSIEALN